ncbi:hypothetical protein CK203_015608 [Vitis vinifera]|uniref:VOC domain-containing protein n=1 Tax=Vitis vinifera TaxID=29760 RepID=A0A438J588_VITVI|nr:hypothetical protein CK203_089704 [Vitis vinifera]RVX04122.1 hypothetical protein CK203_015608 [Vitis vinifera]
MAASFRWILQLHKDVPRAARFYSEGLDFTINVCTLRWAELQSGPLKLALMQNQSQKVSWEVGSKSGVQTKFGFFLYTWFMKEDTFGVEGCLPLFKAGRGCIINYIKMQLLTWFHSDHDMQKGYSSLLSFTVTDINSTVTKLMALGAELDGPIKYEIHGKVAAMRCIDGHMLGLYEAA